MQQLLLWEGNNNLLGDRALLIKQAKQTFKNISFLKIWLKNIVSLFKDTIGHKLGAWVRITSLGRFVQSYHDYNLKKFIWN